MTTATTIQELAAEVRKQFTRASRPNGDTFWKLDRAAQDWVYDLCRAAHGSMLPDDWRYAFIVDALDAISEHEDTDTARDSIEPDIYYHELIQWLGSHGSRPGYCDDARTSDVDIMGLIQRGQVAERLEVFDSVLASLQDHLKTLKTETENE